MKTMAIILAAGEGKRMGMPKALLEYEKGRSFLRALASTFGKAGCSVMAVVGSDAETVRDNTPDVHLIENGGWQDGAFSSAKAGLRAALEEGAETLVLHPVDMPAVRASTLKTLISKADGVDAIVPEFEGATGHPVILSRAAAEKLAQADAPSLEAALQAVEVRRIATKDPGVVVNVNTPEVYERIFSQPPKLADPPRKGGRKAAAG